MRTLSSTVKSLNSRMVWKVRATPRATICEGNRPTSDRPRKRMSPLSGWYTPVIRLNTVVLPAPLGPMSPTRPPSGTCKFTLRTACSPPKRRLRSLISSSTGRAPFARPQPPQAPALVRGDEPAPFPQAHDPRGPQDHEEHQQERRQHHAPHAHEPQRLQQ